ncbi:MAG: hypothetical protein ACI4JQ_07550 [Ruminococcus sp.]
MNLQNEPEKTERLPISAASEPESAPLNKQQILHAVRTSISLLFLLLSIGMVLYYIWGPARYEFHSDCTDTIYWAEAAMEGKGLINPDFQYATVMPFGGNLFMQLWMPFFGVSMLTHTLGMTTFFAVFTAALFWLLHELKWSMSWRFITIAGLLTALSASEKIREIFWGHIIYYSLGMLFLLLGMSLVLHIYNLREKVQTPRVRHQTLFFLILLLGLFTTCCTNSTTAIALFSLPVIAALFLERFLDHTVKLTAQKNLFSGILLLLCVLGTIAGMLLGKWIAGDVVPSYANAYSYFTSPDSWQEHLEQLPLAFLNLIGLDVDTDTFLTSLSGIQTILLLFYAALLVILPIAALFCYRKITDTGFRMLIWAHFTCTAFILIGYICGMLYTANWRLSPLIVTGFLVSLSFLRWLYQKSSTRRLGILLLLPVGYSCMQSILGVLQMPANAYLQSASYQLSEYLQQQGLNYGYATFWNSQVITVQSNAQCKVRTVSIDEDGVNINLYQSNKNWYDDQPGQEEYFLLMSPYEKSVLTASDSPVPDMPHRTLEYMGYTIWIFEENLF